MRRICMLSLLLLGTSMVGSNLGAQQPAADPVFEPNGFLKARHYFSDMEFEHIDPIGGGLVLTFTDLILRGNAGMDLVFQRTYNSNAGGWSFGLAGLPLEIRVADGANVNESTPRRTPVIVTADGGEHRTRPTEYTLDPIPAVYMTAEFWRYDRTSRILELPNGWRLQYSSGNPAVLQEVRDSHNNWITLDWVPGALGSQSLQAVHQGFNRPDGEPFWRSVTFTGGAPVGLLPATMVFNGRTWSYDLTPARNLNSVTPPEGRGWSFDYTDGLLLTTPFGGQIHYRFDSHTFGREGAGGQTISVIKGVLASREVLGVRELESGTSTYSYTDDSTASGETTITYQDGRRLTRKWQRLWLEDDPFYSPFQEWWVVNEAIRRDSTGNTVSREQFAYIAADVGESSGTAIGTAPVLHARTLEYGGRTFTTVHDYSVDNFGDYHRPWKTVEAGDLSRQTTRAFDHAFTRWIRGKVSSETVTVSGQSATIARSFNHDTGFVENETRHGVTTTFHADTNGNVDWTEDAHGHRTNFTYEWGTLKNTTTPAGFSITRQINVDGTIFKETRRGASTEYGYDALGRVTTVKPPLGDWIVTDYEPNGLWVKVSRGDRWTRYTLDGFGRVVGTENKVGVKTARDYDVFGRVKFESLPYYGSAAVGMFTTYDDLDRMSTQTQSNGQQTVYEHTNGVDVTITEHNGPEVRTTTQNWAAFGGPSDRRLVGIVDAEGGAWAYEYDTIGHLTRVDAPDGPDRVWTYKVDPAGRNMDLLESETHPESGVTTYSYLGNRLESKTVANGAVTITFGYDANDRVTSIGAPGSGNSVTLDYDDSDNRILLQNGTVTSRFKFDAANRLEWRKDTITGEPERETSYTYWGSDDIKTLTYPSGTVVNYTYDDGGRATSVRRGEASSGMAVGQVLDYHPSGAIKHLKMGNNIEETFTYDENRYWLKTISGGPLGLTYGYDAIGNVKSIQDSRSEYNQGFSYDRLDRLRFVTGYGARELQYDPLGNRTFKSSPEATYTYDPTTKRLQSVSGPTPNPEVGSYVYGGADGAAGNVTGDPSGSYAHTPFNMLATATVGGVTTGYGYDGDNIRTVRAQSTGRDLFYHVAGRLLSEFRHETGVAVARWVRDSIYLGDRIVASFSPPLPTVEVVASASSVAEGAGTASLTVRVTTPDGTPLQIPLSATWTTENGTAVANADYTAASGTISFSPDTPSGTTSPIQVSIAQDAVLEEDVETFSVRLSGVQNGRIGAAAHTVSIRDDEPRVAGLIDVPATNSTQYQTFHLGGWAIDSRATVSTGIDIVAFGARPVGGGAEISLGTAAFGPRDAVAVQYGPQFLNSGFGINLAPSLLTIGVTYDIWVYVHFSRNDTWGYLPTPVRVSIASSAVMTIDGPQPTTVGQRFTVTGYVFDRAASSGTAIDAATMTVTPLAGGSPIDIGPVGFERLRRDVGFAYGNQFSSSGFEKELVLTTPGTYRIEVRAHSTITGWHSRTRDVTVGGSPLMWLEAPGNGTTIAQPFLVSGWAIDRAAASGTGVSTVHVWAHPVAGGTSVFLGAATPDARQYVADIYGQQFLQSGFTIASVTGLAAGQWRIEASAWSTVTGGFNQVMSATVSVTPPPSTPAMWLEQPGNNSTTGQPFLISGWAVDLAAPTGSGVSTVHVWAHPLAGGSSVFLGVGIPDARQYVADIFGQQFLNSGFTIAAASGLTPGQWQVVAYAMSTQTGTFNQAMGATITIPTPNALVSMDLPAANATVSQPFHVGGWAIDLASPNTVGISQIHLYAFSSTGQQIPLGQLSVANPRNDVAAYYGAHYLNSGWGVNVSGLAPGTYTIWAFPVSPANQGVPGWVYKTVTVQ